MADKANEMTECSLPIVSVIIPVYNTEKYLRQCLDTVIAQTLKEIEIICIDDGSTDRSLEILHEYQERDNRIIILTQQNKGGGAARNAGLKIAQGKYLLFLDSDDFFEKDMLEKSYDKSEENVADIVIFATKSYSEKKGRLLHAVTGIPINGLPKTPTFDYTALPDQIFTAFRRVPWNKFYRTEFVRSNNLQFQELFIANDIQFICLSLVMAKRIVVLNEVFVYYRVDMPNNCQANVFKHPYAVYQANIQLREKLDALNVLNIVESGYLNMVLRDCISVLKKLKQHPNEYRLLYEMLQSEGFEKLGISESKKIQMSEKWIYNWCMTIKNTPFSKMERTDLISKLQYTVYHYYMRYRIPEFLFNSFNLLKYKGLLYTIDEISDKIKQ